MLYLQNSRVSEEPAGESKTISSEIASTINDGLYFYEQVDTLTSSYLNNKIIALTIINLQELNPKWSHCSRNKPIDESRNANTRYSAKSATIVKSGFPGHSNGRCCCEEPEDSYCQEKLNKGSSKHHSNCKQRLFLGNFRAHGSSQDSLGITSESPPSDAVGFFFGPTPPDSNR